MGIRKLLIAHPSQRSSFLILGIVGRSVLVVLMGIVPGLLLAAACGRWIQPLLYRTSALDPLTFTCAARLMFLVAITASTWAGAEGVEHGSNLAGLPRADSLTLDPHKGMFLPYGTGALLVRDGVRAHLPHLPGSHRRGRRRRLGGSGRDPGPRRHLRMSAGRSIAEDYLTV